MGSAFIALKLLPNGGGDVQPLLAIQWWHSVIPIVPTS